MKLQRMKHGQHFICLPNQIIKAKGWEKGDNVEVKLDPRGRIFLELRKNGKSAKI